MTRIAHALDEVEALGGYKILYADCPWSYAQGGRGSIDGKYSGMSIDALCALPITRLVSKDAVLFTWGTWPCLPEMMRTITAWGFVYKTCGFVWVKYREPSKRHHVGGGFWTRANTEYCLIAVRGKNHPKRLDTSKGIRQLVETEPEEILEAPLTEHSAKPAIVRDRIVQLMGDLPRIELFARERVAGWDAWGDDPRLGGSDVALIENCDLRERESECL